MHSIQTTTDVDQQLKGSISRVYYTCNVMYKLHVKEYTKIVSKYYAITMDFLGEGSIAYRLSPYAIVFGPASKFS